VQAQVDEKEKDIPGERPFPEDVQRQPEIAVVEMHAYSVGAAVLVGVLLPSTSSRAQPSNRVDDDSIRISVVFNNVPFSPDVETSWGGSCGVEGMEQTILFDAPIDLLLGGFHLSGASGDEVRAIIQRLKAIGVERVAPSHRTGDEAMRLFRTAWGENFVEGGVGAVIEVAP